MFSAKTYIERRRKFSSNLRKTQGNSPGVALFLGNEESPRNYAANIFPFRQDSSFLYYFGLDTSGLAALIDLESGEEIIFGNELTMDDIVWTGPLPTVGDMAGKVGISQTMPLVALGEMLKKATGSGRRVHFLPPYQTQQQIQLFELLGIPPVGQKSAASEPMVMTVIGQRLIKSAEELDEIEMAVNTTQEMHVSAMEYAAPGMLEAEVHGVVEAVALSANGYVSFPPIVTTHGQVLHNHHYHHELKSGQLLLVDCGAESAEYYAGDMTRTFPVDKKFTTKQREVYQVVLDAQMTAIKALAPGVLYQDVHLLAAQTIASGMKSLGLMKGNTDEAVAAGAHALFFQHGLGHMMGLDVHDCENLGENFVGYGPGQERSNQFGLGFLRLARSLEPGHVLTIEPGIYFIPELWAQWKSEKRHEDFINYDAYETYLDFGGIRIEEDFVITDNGSKLLGFPAPKSIADVEALREGAI